MDGRVENDFKREMRIKKILSNLPIYVSNWNNSMIANGSTSSTRLDFIRKVNRFLTFVNKNPQNIELSDFSRLTVDNYLSSIVYKKTKSGELEETSDSYKCSIWSCLNNFFEFLYDYKMIDEMPINIKKKPQNNDLPKINSKRILLDEDDYECILDSVQNGVGTKKGVSRQSKWKNRDTSIILLFMTTGMRVTALTEINISDIDFDNNILIIRDKGDKIQDYYINEKTMSGINNWLEDRKNLFPKIKTDALFISYQGERISSKGIVKLVKKYCNDGIGLNISPHKFRSGFCSIMYKQTNDIEKVRRMVGHSNSSTTQRYVVTGNQERKEASLLMNNIL